ncbi:phosphoribosylanthranilate isomerase [Rhodopseudomonas palustris HaA2]|uniref:N-(5'-phosphoribosyl)anthranilate isomerase n=1 Tax=Rhodopseudomonas palustris (strain HaA2) TaxID=316058 RepID=TRPF_RHOP2|nr:phosphoribosylanthranilate isomerase [Rhodopseudomonas palustris]Q2J2G3.1 RecName: Full=N-(5'-phosphoribosyl)anthranilate isomerase; Short=PRAI [Rhodopseudomonas palustris HaA2]ABD05347.1 phosphoribosylanthranilate isomerase [Rhodopseudomonas palustris HaA2]
MSVVVKICGLSTRDTLEAAVAAGADMVGFVFFPASPRHVGFDLARALGDQVGSRAAKVALTVDASDALLRDVVDALAPDLLQLHGKESPERVRAIRQTFGLPVMKAVAVATADDLAALPAYAAAADRILFDARPPKDALRPGGLGVPFDWALLSGLALPVPYMVSGGITPGNVAEALRVTRAGGIDVSSGVETAPGVKDSELIRSFIRATRASEETMT